MSRGRRKHKVNKRLKSSAVVPPTSTTETASLPAQTAKFEPDKTVLASKEIFIAAPVECCFDTLAKQLEQSPDWDPIIANTQPVSKARGKIGATSQVKLNLGRRELESLAMVSRYRPNRAISWTLSSKPKVREDWHLEPKPQGTVVSVTLACEIPGWVIVRFLYKVKHRKQAQQDLDTMLNQLKKAVEGISRDQKLMRKGKL
jgi:hypothetical protein